MPQKAKIVNIFSFFHNNSSFSNVTM
jgi:hypothetical protein